MPELPARAEPDFQLVLVCTANQIRSPIAEALVLRFAGALPLATRSRGLLDLGPKSPPPAAIEAAADLGLDISTHRSRRLEPGSLRESDAVVGFEPVHVARPCSTAARSSSAPSSCASSWSCSSRWMLPRRATRRSERDWPSRARTPGGARFPSKISRRLSTIRTAAVAARIAAPSASSESWCRGSSTASSGRHEPPIVGSTDSGLRIVLVAEEAAGIRVLRALDSLDHTVVAVLADDAVSEQQTVAGLARRLELPVRPPGLVTSGGFAETLRRENVDLLLNVHSLQLVAPDVLAAPAIGSFNLHPGPLPRYAGLDVPSWAIYNRETQSRVDPPLAHAPDRRRPGRLLGRVRRRAGRDGDLALPQVRPARGSPRHDARRSRRERRSRARFRRSSRIGRRGATSAAVLHTTAGCSGSSRPSGWRRLSERATTARSTPPGDGLARSSGKSRSRYCAPHRGRSRQRPSRGRSASASTAECSWPPQTAGCSSNPSRWPVACSIRRRRCLVENGVRRSLCDGRRRTARD